MSAARYTPPPFMPAAYFPGPKSENEAWARAEFQTVLDHWFDWRRSLFRDDPSAIPDDLRLSADFLKEREIQARALRRLTDLLCAETPKYTPRYIGHMVSELSLPALFGHFAALLHNPNNTSKEVSRVGSVIEAEGIAMLAQMLGYDPAAAQGHFTGGGTMANFEAVWRARYRMDHWLSLALTLAERDGDALDIFSAAHMGWDRFNALRAERGVSDEEMQARSTVLQNPFEIGARLSKAAARDWRGPVMIVPGNKHFSWRKAANVFGLGESAFLNAPLDAEGRLDGDGFSALVEQAREQARPVLLAVTVAGTTEAGEIDPVDAVADRLDALRGKGVDIWHHVDAAFGGFFCAMLGGAAQQALDPARQRALAAVARSDSVTIDPHKLGYIPYACGAFITRDKRRYQASSFQAPYIERKAEGDKWSCTLEGSRSAAGAAATWLTGQTLGFGPERFGALLAATIDTRKAFEAALAEAAPLARLLRPADTNILCFSLARDGEALSAANARTERAFERFQADPDFAVSQTVLSAESYGALIAAHAARHDGAVDSDRLVLLRLVLMNPFWADAGVRAALLPRFVEILNRYSA
ncbi:MAG: hypothetical protein KIS81_03630 [Maricaulaceae bacterium]|nr:hypothetical protein [Maricaulaceae bacterium]